MLDSKRVLRLLRKLAALSTATSLFIASCGLAPARVWAAEIAGDEPAVAPVAPTAGNIAAVAPSAVPSSIASAPLLPLAVSAAAAAPSAVGPDVSSNAGAFLGSPSGLAEPPAQRRFLDPNVLTELDPPTPPSAEARARFASVFQPGTERSAQINRNAEGAARALGNLGPKSDDGGNAESALSGPQGAPGAARGSGLIESSRSKILRAGTTLSALYRLMRSNPYTRVNMAATDADEPLMRNNGYSPRDSSQITRPELLSMAQQAALRPALVGSLLADLHDRSDEIVRAIAAAEEKGFIDPAAQAYDYVVIGAGVHDQIFNNVMTNGRGARLKGLTITRTDGIADNFSNPGDFFRLNSTSRPTKSGVLPLPGSGNLNELPGGPIQVPDLDPNKNPSARALGDAVTMNRASAASDVLFRHEVVSVLDGASSRNMNGWPARYRVQMLDERNQVHFVYADTIVDAAGIGKPDVSFEDDESDQIVTESFATTARNPSADTGLWSFEGFARRAGLTDTPYREFVGQDVVIVGGRDVAKGDSAKVTLQWFLRLALPAAYGRDVAQMGYMKSIDWVGVSAKDCVDFINNTRTPYAEIAGGFKSQSVQGVDGQLVRIRRSRQRGKRWNLRYKMRDGSFVEKEADAIILATGYKQLTYQRYEDIVTQDGYGLRFSARSPLQNTDAVVEVKAPVEGLGRVTVAKKLKGQNIYFVGPNAGKIVDPGDQVGVLENAASIYATGKLTAGLAELLSAVEAKGFPRLERAQPIAASYTQGKAARFILRRAYIAPIRAMQPGQGAYLEARVAGLLAGFKFPQARIMKLLLTRLDSAPGIYALEVRPGFFGSRLLAESLNRDSRFVEAVASMLNGDENQLTVSVDPRRPDSPAEVSLARTSLIPADLSPLPRYIDAARPPDRPDRIISFLYTNVIAFDPIASAYQTLREQQADAAAAEKRTMGQRLKALGTLGRASKQRPLDSSALASLFLLARREGADPNDLTELFESVRNSPQFEGLNSKEQLALFSLAKLRSDPSLKDAADYQTFLAGSRPSGADGEARLKMFVLSRLLNRDPRELLDAFDNFEGAAAAQSDEAPGALPVFFLATLLGRDAKRLYDEYLKFAGSGSRSRGGPVREKTGVFALAKLLGVNPETLFGEYVNDRRRLSLDDKALTPDEIISLFFVPYATRSQIDAKQIFFF